MSNYKPFSLLVKPAGADCNLRCKYCFYIDHLEIQEPKPRMSDETLERMISSYMNTNQNGNYAFGWQGGEPTLMGLDFFKNVVKYQQKYGHSGALVSNGLQTNGTLITDEMAKFFAQYKFLIGVSLDGPLKLHNHYRKTIGGKDSHSMVMKGIKNLRKYDVQFNILMLVNDVAVRQPEKIYKYMLDNSFYFHQYIPCIEFDENNDPLPFSITGEQWGDFLCKIFDLWAKKDKYRVSIRLFDSILEHLIYGETHVCYMNNNCCQYFVVEYNGGIYPCDFFVRDDLKLGNINTGDWKEFLNSSRYKKFGSHKSILNEVCKACPFLNICYGDCQKNRPGNTNNPKTLSFLCKGWKKFYAHTLPSFENLAKKIRLERNIPKRDLKTPVKFGRNDPCPCGSGEKYKKCCMKPGII
ncbi:MAG: anaerobic sulfatase maturase [Candidatus Lokiarchaeota archaeon]|nr:anaerobic sulfatase maturase [Candidatus Lokiarchaeota archaeon]